MTLLQEAVQQGVTSAQETAETAAKSTKDRSKDGQEEPEDDWKTYLKAGNKHGYFFFLGQTSDSRYILIVLDLVYLRGDAAR